MELTKTELMALLSTTDFHKEITASTGVPVWKLENLIKRYSLQGYRDENRYKCIEHLLTVDSPDFCYLLGLWVTDGYWNEGAWCIGLNDRDVLHRLGKIFNCKVYTSKQKGKSIRYIFTLPSRFCDKIRELGYTQGAKTFDVHLPYIPKENWKYVIRGMLDGDGSITKIIRNYSASFFSVSKNLLMEYTRYLTELGFKYSIHSHGKYGKSNVVVNSLDFLLYVYTDRYDLCLDRKLKTVNDKVEEIVQAYSIIKNRR